MFSFLLCLGLLQAPAAQAAAGQDPAAPPAVAATAPTPSQAVDGKGSPSFSVPRIEEQATIDGRLDEQAWSKAARLGGFSEYQPVDSQRASERTEVLIWYSPKALHVGIIAHDSVPGSVRATVADRDNIANEDWVRVYLDTFNDRRRAFIFGVNPLGVQEDGVQTEGGYDAGHAHGVGGGAFGGSMMSGQVDLSPDYQFDSKGRSPTTATSSRSGSRSRACATPAPARCAGASTSPARRSAPAGRTRGPTRSASRASSPRPARWKASTTCSAASSRSFSHSSRPRSTARGRTMGTSRMRRRTSEPGANLRFGFTNMSIDATVNPDFSQVETDASQVTVNERFALFYPEKRPFFLEGIELFATPNQLVYTSRSSTRSEAAR